MVGQGELLAALAVVLALDLYVRARRRGTVTPVAGAGIAFCYALGCLSKEHATVLPALVVVVELAAFPRVALQQRTRELGLMVGALIAVATIFWTVRGMIVGGVGGVDIHPIFRGATTGQRLLTSLGSVPTWTMLLLFPWRLRADYGPADYTLADGIGPMQGMGLVLALAIAAIAWRLRKGAPIATAGIVPAALALAPVSNVVVPTGVIVAERVLLLPSVGAVLAFAALLRPWLEGPRQRLLIGALTAVAPPAALLSMLRVTPRPSCCIPCRTRPETTVPGGWLGNSPSNVARTPKVPRRSGARCDCMTAIPICWSTLPRSSSPPDATRRPNR